MTGREPQIAGYGDETVNVSCGVRTEWVAWQTVWNITHDLQRAGGDMQKVARSVEDLKRFIDTEDFVLRTECDFEGDIEASIEMVTRSVGLRYWTCPRCHTDHTEDFDLRDE